MGLDYNLNSGLTTSVVMTKVDNEITRMELFIYELIDN